MAQTTPEAPTLEETIELLIACDDAFLSCADVVGQQDVILEQQANAIDLQAKRISELKADRDSFWKNPLVWGFAGIAAGVLGGVLVNR